MGTEKKWGFRTIAAVLAILLLVCVAVRVADRRPPDRFRPLPPVDALAKPTRAWSHAESVAASAGEAVAPRQPAGASVARAPSVDPREKMSSDLLAALDSGDPDRTYRVIVQPPRDRGNRVEAVRSFREHLQTAGVSSILNLDFIGATVLELGEGDLLELASRHDVGRVSLDAKVRSTCLELPVQVVGADRVWEPSYPRGGLTGDGVTVAVIDSGVDRRHPDFKKGLFGSRVSEQTFVGSKGDAFGHGTHVAGIVGGSGATYDDVHGGPNPAIGVAPEVDILSLRVLDEHGVGYSSSLILAIGYATVFKEVFGIRVLNLSLGHPVYESYLTDPLTLACAVAVTRGIAVVCSAGNAGSSDGETVYGSISSPGNAPWVITVGATNPQCTVDRADDTIATFSSRGPTAIDGLAKPDLVAPGVHIVNCQPLGPDFIDDNYPVAFVLGDGSDDHYMVLNGTSMAAPMVAGTLALMFEANPGLTPNMAKAALLYTAEKMVEPNVLEQGSGMLNTEGAVRFALGLKGRQSDLPLGEFQLDASGPEEARGMLLPFTNIAGRKAYWGASFLYGGRVIWGRGNVLAERILWGNGRVWSDTLLWTHGEPWYDELVATKTPVFADTVLWSHGGQTEVIWADTMLWTNGDFPGVYPDSYVMSETILWSYSEIHDEWSGQMAHPDSIESQSIGILVEGEEYETTGATFIDESSPYYPQEEDD